MHTYAVISTGAQSYVILELDRILSILLTLLDGHCKEKVIGEGHFEKTRFRENYTTKLLHTTFQRGQLQVDITAHESMNN